MAVRREIHCQIEKYAPYVRLFEDGELVKNQGTRPVVEHLLELRWAKQSRRKTVLEITKKGQASIPAFLDNVWPEWRRCHQRLKEAGRRFNLEGWLELEAAERAEAIVLPKRLHHKTLASCLGLHSKSKRYKGLEGALEAVEQTTDQVLRFRPNRGLRLRCGGSEIDCGAVAEVLGEVSIPERAFADGLQVEGVVPKVIVTVENLGAYIDWPEPDPEHLIVFSPGKDTVLALRFLALLPSDFVYFHFGDLDPDGLRIAKYLQDNSGRNLRLLVPEFWEEFLEVAFAVQKKGRDETGWEGVEKISEDEPEILGVLRQKGEWLEQEAIVVDARFARAISVLGKEGE